MGSPSSPRGQPGAPAPWPTPCPWPAEPDELVDRLVADHLKGLLPTEDLQSGRELGGVRIENPFA
ncbi:MAG TPA: hypothetical protein VGS14_02605 [Actinomycetes bacterium]|nr:hypothetical protein [Actinomycetes bacterium]